jgi:hypothetical protein
LNGATRIHVTIGDPIAQVKVSRKASRRAAPTRS